MVLREHASSPIVALSHLRDWQIFNYLIGNWDGHAKNLALLYSPDQTVPTLALFYDLVAIEFFNHAVGSDSPPRFFYYPVQEFR